MTTIRWGRVIGLAFALEAALFAALLPIQPLMSKTAWVTCVAIACGVFGLAAGWLCGRGLASRAVLHGALTGILATVIYLLINVFAGGIGAAAAFYGWPVFVLLQRAADLRLYCRRRSAQELERSVRVALLPLL